METRFEEWLTEVHRSHPTVSVRVGLAPLTTMGQVHDTWVVVVVTMYTCRRFSE
jgi:hypothetical protein